MTETQTGETYQNGDETKINYYHAHIYYGDDDAVREKAARLREKAWAKWPGQVRMGRFRDTAVGPHPLAMYQMAFAVDSFPAFVPWLQSVRGPLSILVHTRTGLSDLLDHSVGAMWLGSSLELKLDFFDRDGKSA